ncbi:uncharacterized protein L203_103794 [Cryptococcus depauperatus CBS 7841]|uniref:Carboxylic ester hydrolase n=1 Tax=Cryptococcus depauperatus CBS 7841 TaxID=1295531 RepID=A0AAJ8JUB1_9TREE
MRWSIFVPLLLPLATAYPWVPRQEQSTSAVSSAAPTCTKKSHAGPQAPVATIYPDTAQGKPIEIKGVRQESFFNNAYLGIPYAQPPIGDMRFRHPESYTYNTSSFDAQTPPPGCPQASSNTSDLVTSEDCLQLNVFTPLDANASSTPLPVMVWVYGGSFTSGAASIYDGSSILGYGLKTNRPVVYVALNYRLGALGWGFGSGFAENNAANLGLRDIKKALSWVKENIRAFGGDPDSVTVFGESAGAISISLLFLDPDVDLFKSAIMESGAPSTTPTGPADSAWEDAYQALLTASNCTNPTQQTTPFECLRELPVDELFAAQTKVEDGIWYAASAIYGPAIDGDLIPESPHKLLSEGKFANKPFITGTNKDEGTYFIPPNVTDEKSAMEYFALNEPFPLSNETMARLFTLYPNDIVSGSPYDTGNETFGLSPAFKQSAAILGDVQFEAPRRYFIRQANQFGNNKTWAYHFEQHTPGSAPQLGVYHTSEVPYVFGIARPEDHYSPLSSNYTETDSKLADSILNYWINFAYYNDPNGNGSGTTNATCWKPHVLAENKNILRLETNNISIFQDDFREEQMDFLNDNYQEFNM